MLARDHSVCVDTLGGAADHGLEVLFEIGGLEVGVELGGEMVA